VSHSYSTKFHTPIPCLFYYIFFLALIAIYIIIFTATRFSRKVFSQITIWRRSLIRHRVKLSLFNCHSIIIKTIIQETLETILVRNKLLLKNKNSARLNIRDYTIQPPRELHSITRNECGIGLLSSEVVRCLAIFQKTIVPTISTTLVILLIPWPIYLKSKYSLIRVNQVENSK